MLNNRENKNPVYSEEEPRGSFLVCCYCTVFGSIQLHFFFFLLDFVSLAELTDHNYVTGVKKYIYTSYSLNQEQPPEPAQP